jgi:uncharacterized protein (TIGR00369 family)
LTPKEELVATDPDVLEGISEGMKLVPYNAALQLRAEDASADGVTVVLPYRLELVGNPDTGVLHGGAITALLDAACGMAVFFKMPTPTRVATLDLRIDYLKPATPSKDVRTRAQCYKLTRQVAFTRATAYHDDPDDPIASAVGTFIIFEDAQSPMAQAASQKR